MKVLWVFFTDRWFSLLGPNESLMSLCRWMAKWGILSIGLGMWTSRWTSLASLCQHKRQYKFKIKEDIPFKTQKLRSNCLGIFMQTVIRFPSCTHNIFKRFGFGTLWYRHDQLMQLPWPWRGQQWSDLCQTRCSKSHRRNTQHRPGDSPASSS